MTGRRTAGARCVNWSGGHQPGRQCPQETLKGDFKMLVITRREQEAILIGDNIRVTIVNIAPGRVRVGIDAPRDVVITREELLARPTGDTANPEPSAGR